MAVDDGEQAWVEQLQAGNDESLIGELLIVLGLTETDMTIFFRRLASFSTTNLSEEAAELVAPLRDAYYVPDELNGDVLDKTATWLQRYAERVQMEGVSDADRQVRMNRVNPKYVMRNYLAQLAIDKSEQGDHSLVNELLDVMRHPYDEQPEKEQFAEKRPEWARHRAGCSMLSCSS